MIRQGRSEGVNLGETNTSINGKRDVIKDRNLYPFWMQDGGGLAGARFDKAIHADSAGDNAAEATVGLAGDLVQATRAVLSADNEETVANELRTMLNVGGSSFSMAALLEGGSATDSGDNFVGEARKAIEKIRGDVAALLGLDDEPAGLTGILQSRWGAIQTEVTKVFGTTGTGDDAGNKVTVTQPRNNDDLLAEIDDIIAALSSSTQFVDATNADGTGVFKAAALSADNAMKAFDANESEATATFGATAETRYGAISKKTRTNALADLAYSMGTSGTVGAFSYATTDDVQRVWNIEHSGTAYYEGDTSAVSGNGNLYTGDIEISVRFASNRVSGLITNLTDTDGNAWSYQYGEVESIILPTATNLNNSAHWSTGADAKAQVTFTRRAGSPTPASVDATFNGQLLGKAEDVAGDWAHGVWSVGTQTTSGTSTYMAGGFGAERGPDVGPARPGTDDGSAHETTVMGVGELLSNTAKLDGGNLVVTMNVGDRKLASETTTVGPDGSQRTILGADTTAPSDPGGWAFGSSGQHVGIRDKDSDMSGLQAAITRELTVALTKLNDNAGNEVNTNGPNKQVAIAVAAIEAARADLAVLQGLDTKIPTAEMAAWKKVQGALLRIFHHVPPKLAEAYDENDALGLIDSVLSAFASSANLKVAIDPDGTGIFNNVTKGDNAHTSPDSSVIWGRQEVQMKAWLDNTNYTRFGAWRVRQDKFAASDAWSQPHDGDTLGNDPGVFAYSPLLPTTWSASGTGASANIDPSFPGGGRAMFSGKSVAIMGTGFKEGTAEILAEWSAASADNWNRQTGENDAFTGYEGIGTLTMTLRGMANPDGDLLKTPAADDAKEIERLVFTGIRIDTNKDHQAVFNSTDATVNAYSGPQGTDSTSMGTNNDIVGKFVGQDADGPFGVLGTYMIEFGDRDLYGAFGADKP